MQEGNAPVQEVDARFCVGDPILDGGQQECADVFLPQREVADETLHCCGETVSF